MARGRSKSQIPEAIREVVKERSGEACEAMIYAVCTGRAEHMHHRKISGREHLVVNILHLCRACHMDYIHKNPEASRENGWLVKMNYDPSEVPVMYRGQPVMLFEDGRIKSYFKPRGDAGLSS